MEKTFRPEDPRWPSSPVSPDAVSTRSAPSLDADASGKLPYYAIFLFDCDLKSHFSVSCGMTMTMEAYSTTDLGLTDCAL